MSKRRTTDKALSLATGSGWRGDEIFEEGEAAQPGYLIEITIETGNRVNLALAACQRD